jgi:hypothetical protein
MARLRIAILRMGRVAGAIGPNVLMASFSLAPYAFYGARFPVPNSNETRFGGFLTS